MSEGEDDIQEFEDSEDPNEGINQEQGIGVEIADKDEIDFLDGLSELAFLQSELYEVRGQLSERRSNGQYVPLRLYRSHCGNSLSVTDIQSSMWCERQLEYRYLYPYMKKTKQWREEERRKGKEIPKKTPVMITGTTIHEKKELEVHKKVVVATNTREDRWAVDLLNTYKQLSIVKGGGMEREIQIFGDLFNTGILVKGVIDQLQFSPETQELVLTDLKTRMTDTMPGETQMLGHKLQVMAYKLLLDGLTRGSTRMDLLAEHLDLNFKAQLSLSVVDHICELRLLSHFSTSSGDVLEVRLEDLVKTLSRLIRGLDLPPVSSLAICYESQRTHEVIGEVKVDLDEAWAKGMFSFAVRFWRGEREPTGPEIEDLWKCDTCQYSNVCVWRKQKMLETAPGLKILDSPVKSPAVKIPTTNQAKKLFN